MTKFRSVFNFHDPDAKGRSCVLIYKVVEGFLVYIITGVFYAAFLDCYGMSSVDGGILAFVPYIASLLVLFMPSLLNHFPKRRWILAICKMMYYFLSLIGLTILPAVVSDNKQRLIGMIIITFIASAFNVVATAGYAAWHIRFQPNEVRAYFLSSCLLMTAVVAGVLSLASGWIEDMLGAMNPAFELKFLIGLRIFAFVLGAIDVAFLLLPREVEYPKMAVPRFSDIFAIPLKNKKFMLTMLVVFLWQFSCYCYDTQLNFLLANVLRIPKLYINFIIFLYSVCFIATTKFWQKFIQKTSWFYVYAVALLIVAPFQIMYGFVTPFNYVWLMLVVRVPQHVAGTGHNTAFDNFQYINMPIHDRECYAAFYQIVFNIGAAIGKLFGLLFDAKTMDWKYTLFGYTYESGKPLLIMLCGVVQIIIAVFIFAFRKHLEPDKNAETV